MITKGRQRADLSDSEPLRANAWISSIRNTFSFSVSISLTIVTYSIECGTITGVGKPEKQVWAMLY